MEELSEIKKTDNIIFLGDKCNLNSMRNEYEMYNSAKIITFEDFMNENFPEESQDYVVSAVHFEPITPEIISKSIKILKPNGKIFVAEFKSPLENLDFVLRTTGFVNIKEGNSICCASKPNYKIGSAARLNLPNPASSTIWKLDDDAEDNNDETIDPDELLDEDDLKKPDPSSLRVCGTTGQRKACKDCSCGLADELAAEAQSGKVVDTANAPKSSCGSCYLGDAFRCATCPYLGMPAFKPGEKIQLEGNLLQDDL